MPEGLLVDGKPLDIAAAAPPKDEYPAPPPKAPNANGDAPYGYTRDGRPKIKPGRPRKDAPRVQDAPQAKPAEGQVVSGAKDYAQGLQDVASQVWTLLAFVSPADAGAFKVTSPQMVVAWNKAAQQQPKIGNVIDWLTREVWITGVIAATLPLVAVVAANHGVLPDNLMAKADAAAQREQLAEMTANDLQELAKAMAVVPEAEAKAA